LSGWAERKRMRERLRYKNEEIRERKIEGLGFREKVNE
jgi:hypothetical protein